MKLEMRIDTYNKFVIGIEDIDAIGEFTITKEWTSIHVFCRTAEFAFIKPSTDPGRSIRIYQEYHKNTIFTILTIY